jgi:hypothetical protein
MLLEVTLMMVILLVLAVRILAETETGMSYQVDLAVMLEPFIPEVLGSKPSLGTGFSCSCLTHQ